MFAFIATLALGVFTLTAISVQKVYGRLPAKELKRRAQAGDEFAYIIYRAVAYGLGLTVFLWGLIGISAAVLFWVMARWLPMPLAVLGIVSIIWFGFAWMPNSRVTPMGMWLVKAVSPALAWAMQYVHPALEKSGHAVRKRVTRFAHTGLYEREDFIDLLEQQKAQTDNRLTQHELDIALHALTFGDKLVRDIMIPRSQVRTATETDTIGPILLDELHASGHSRFPVLAADNPDKIVGMLYLRDLVNKEHTGTVAGRMHREIHYVHEEHTLDGVLQAFLKTKRHMFVVANSFEETVGIVTIEDVLEQIIGKPIIDEFDQYEDIRAVAARAAAKIHKDQKHDKLVPPPTSVPEQAKDSAEATEVVE